VSAPGWGVVFADLPYSDPPVALPGRGRLPRSTSTYGRCPHGAAGIAWTTSPHWLNSRIG
jgi:hypothetical protein